MSTESSLEGGRALTMHCAGIEEHEGRVSIKRRRRSRYSDSFEWTPAKEGLYKVEPEYNMLEMIRKQARSSGDVYEFQAVVSDNWVGRGENGGFSKSGWCYSSKVTLRTFVPGKGGKNSSRNGGIRTLSLGGAAAFLRGFIVSGSRRTCSAHCTLCSHKGGEKKKWGQRSRSTSLKRLPRFLPPHRGVNLSRTTEGD